MPKPADRIPPMPRIQAINPRDSEQSWESAPQLLAALNGARLGAWYWDIESGQISWSRGTQALFGFDPHQPLPENLEYLDLLPPEDRARTIRAFHSVLAGAPLEQAMHHRIRWPDGSLHWLEINGSVLPDKQGKPRMIGVIREITHQRQREEALSNSEKRFATLIHLCPNMVLLTRLEDGLISEANQYFESQFGWPAEHVIGRTTLEIGLWVNPEQRAQLITAIQKTSQAISLEVQFRASNGQIHDGILSAQKVELEGKAYLLSTFLDTSERKKAEQALKDSQERLDLALDSAQLGTWDVPVPGAELCRVQRQVEAFLAVLQRVFGGFAFGGVQEGAQQIRLAFEFDFLRAENAVMDLTIAGAKLHFHADQFALGLGFLHQFGPFLRTHPQAQFQRGAANRALHRPAEQAFEILVGFADQAVFLAGQ